MSIQDPAITILVALTSGWTLADPLDLSNVKISTGWYEASVTLPQVTVTEFSAVDRPFQLGYGVIRVDALYQVDVWVKILKDTDRGRGVAKSWLWALRREVETILRANLTGLTNLAYLVLNQTGRRLDEPDRALLRFNKLVLVQYDI